MGFDFWNFQLQQNPTHGAVGERVSWAVSSLQNDCICTSSGRLRESRLHPCSPAQPHPCLGTQGWELPVQSPER